MTAERALPPQVVLATSNAGKAREFAALLEPLGTRLIMQDELGITSADEQGLSFVENALLKARHAAAASGLPALADDSGLCIDALGGAPGIRSARFSGEEGPGRDEANNALVLERLSGVGDLSARSARFVCALAMVGSAADPDPLLAVAHWEGQIALMASGQQGFGYDPLFYLPDRGLTAAQLPPQTKNLLSHRGRALLQLRRALQRRGGGTMGPGAGG